MREQVSYKLGGVKHDDRPVEPSNYPEIPDSSSEPWKPKAGEKVRLVETGDIYEIESYSEIYAQYSMKGWPGSCVNLEDIEPVNAPKILDGSGEPLREAFEDWIAPNYDWDQSYFSRNENRYFDSSVEMAWQAFQAGASYQPSPLAPSPCMDGVDVDPFVDGIMEARGRANDPINPSHYKQGGIECIEAIKAATGEGFIGYVWGNVLKYLWRWPKKGGVGDLKKARWYLDRLIKEVGE
jgi:hypothetical protein